MVREIRKNNKTDSNENIKEKRSGGESATTFLEKTPSGNQEKHKSVFVQCDIEQPKLTAGKWLRIWCGLLLTAYGIFSFVYTPFDMFMNERLKMIRGFPPFEWWANPPDEVLLKVYIFNVTNPEAFLNGTDAKLQLQEVGPFVYIEKLRHTDVVFHDNGTMTYLAHRSAVYQPHLSNASLDAKLVVPSLAVLGGASFFARSSFITKMGFNLLMRRMSGEPLVEVTANDYMWNWTDPLVGVARKIMPSLVPVENMGILHRIYSDFTDEVTVFMGPGNGHRFFLIDQFKGSPRLGYWPDLSCDAVANSTEGVTYPQFLTRNATLKYLRKTVCRAATLQWTEDVVQEGMSAFKFELSSSEFHRPANQSQDCYTLPGETPYPSGLADASPCYYNFPIGVSLPHFYGGEDVLFQQVEGMQPDSEKHGSYVIVEPTTGVPMQSRARSQSNLVVRSMLGFPRALHRFSDTIIPMFWLEYGQQGLPWYVSSLMYFTVDILPLCQHWISLSCLLFGCVLFFTALLPHFAFIYRRFVFRYHKFEKVKMSFNFNS